MFKIKICGVTSVEDALMLAEVGVEAVGLNFFEASKRYVDLQTAEAIGRRLPRHVKRVGVFVNASIDRVVEIAETAGLDAVQLHGDEPPEFLGEVQSRLSQQVIRAFRCPGGLEPVRAYLDRCSQAPDAILVDAYDPREYGGTGKTLHWPDLANAAEFVGNLPVILAGGLTPANVAQAIQEARPYGVDVASGVEDAPGSKDEEKCRQFIRAAAAAYAT